MKLCIIGTAFSSSILSQTTIAASASTLERTSSSSFLNLVYALIPPRSSPAIAAISASNFSSLTFL